MDSIDGVSSEAFLSGAGEKEHVGGEAAIVVRCSVTAFADIEVLFKENAIIKGI